MKEKDLAEFRKNDLGFVFQFHHLLKDFTALENVFLPAIMAGHSKKTAENRARILLEEVGLADRMNHLPSELSGGERQRVAIARAMLKDAPIVILDEATSALDNKSEAIVQRALDNLIKNKTVFVIAHRLSTIQNADRIAVVDEGRLAELGTHDELMTIENGKYKYLYEMQFKRQETAV